ncbi:hypothetical protein NPIL_175031 [Nephila pilipes]|uniref:Uncharacterized protein n=1 Tax=Nephila pilipes TaxID=299642 RepID=A0A8X6TM14_NEPPI|nr:hypothetical protein NPIL_175031 [Nephila pilipes]
MTSAMEKHLFNLKFAAKEMERNSKRCEKEEKAEKVKLKKVMFFHLYEFQKLVAVKFVKCLYKILSKETISTKLVDVL